MPSVMDIKHLLCHPCDPYPTKNILRTIPIITNTSTTSTTNGLVDYSMIPKRRRVHSETTFKEYNRHLLTIISRRKSTGNLSTTATTAGHNNQLRVAWTPSEDCLLQQGYEQGLSWGMVASTYLPHRSRGCCWGRFKMLQSKNMISPHKTRSLGRPWKIIN